MKNYLSLKASAGSGKTFALTVRYISLLLLGAKPSEILTLTFTNKAANEMSDRIFSTISNLGNDESYLNEISKQSGLSPDQIINNKDEIMQKFISSELAIYTIDKFINKILREFSGYSGISDDFQIANDDEELLLLNFLNSLDELSFDTLINFAVTENKKINTINGLFKLLLEKLYSFDMQKFQYDKNIFLDLKNCEDTIMLNANKIKEHILNFEAISNTAKNAVNFNDVDSLLDCGKTWLEKDSIKEYRYFKKAYSEPLDSYLHTIKKELGIYFRYREVYTLNKLFELFIRFKNFRDNYNKNKNSLEFNDIINLTYNMLQNFIDKDFLYFRLDARYNHILIDEFQDTSIVQYKILEPLIQEILSGNEEKFKTFFYVGDTKQSIYRFRGGNSELFDYVINRYKPSIHLNILDTNYRSSKTVVNFVNETFKNLPNYEYYDQIAKSGTDGYVEIKTLSMDEESKYKEIEDKLEELFAKGVDPNNIAILTFTNDDVLSLYNHLGSRFKNLKITTEMTSKLIFQENVKAIIELIKYYYFGVDFYKANFNALIGNDYLKNIELKLDIHTISIQELIMQIAEFYKLFDENSIKLVEVSTTYENIIDFIYEIEKNDTPMTNKEKSGLQILTIFKSKGLEFDTVFVLDRIKSKVPDRSSLLFEYDEIELKNCYYKNKGRENFDTGYKGTLAGEKSLTLNDELNILYVGLTRAKNNMIIFKKEKNSVFTMLGNSFTDKCIGKIHINKSKQSIDEKRSNKLVYKALSLGTQDQQIKTNSSDKENIKAKYFGIAAHYTLEMMKNFDTKSLLLAISLAKSRFSNYLNENEFDDIKKRIINLIENDYFSSLIENSHFSKEQSLIYNKNLKILDLLIKKDDKYIIVDYKTSTKNSDEHISQVRLYQNAVKDIFETDLVEGLIVYLLEDTIQILPLDPKVC